MGQIVGYARVSSKGERQSLDLQLDALAAAGCDPRHIFSDTDSGGKLDRPGLEAALAFLQPGDTFVVWKWDRFSRSTRQLVATVADLQARGVEFCSITEKVDTTTPAGRMFFHVCAAIAQFEMELGRERIRAGVEAAASRGRTGGRPRIADNATLALVTSYLKQPDADLSKAARAFNIKRTTLSAALKRYEKEAAANCNAAGSVKVREGDVIDLEELVIDSERGRLRTAAQT